jgi:hypothetical protein
MTILYVAGERETGMELHGVMMSTTADHWKADNARTAFELKKTASRYGRMQTPLISVTGNTVWFHWRFFYTGWNNSLGDTWFYITGGTNRTLLFSIGQQDGRSGAAPMTIYKWDTLAAVATSTGYNLPINTLINMDVEFVYADAAGGGKMNVYVDGELKLSYTGSTLRSGVANINTVAAQWQNWKLNGTTMAVSEIVVATSPTNTIGNVARLEPNETGWYSGQFTGAFGDVNEFPLNDSTRISVATANKAVSYGLDNLPFGVPADQIRGLVTTARVLKGATGPQSAYVGMRSNTGGVATTGVVTLPATATASGLANDWSHLLHHRTTNPDTLAAWTVVETNTAQIYFGTGA